MPQLHDRSPGGGPSSEGQGSQTPQAQGTSRIKGNAMACCVSPEGAFLEPRDRREDFNARSEAREKEVCLHSC